MVEGLDNDDDELYGPGQITCVDILDKETNTASDNSPRRPACSAST